MVKIRVNNKPIEIGQPIPEKVTGVSIQFENPFHSIVPVPHDHAMKLAKWLYELCKATEDNVILYNNTFISKEDIKKCEVFRKVHTHQHKGF